MIAVGGADEQHDGLFVRVEFLARFACGLGVSVRINIIRTETPMLGDAFA